MEGNDNQRIKVFASVILSAGRVSLQADESGIDHYQIAGRPSGSGRIESSNSGGHRDEEIKIRSSSVDLLEQRGLTMKCFALVTDKLCGIDIVDKIFYQFASTGGAF